MKNLRLEVKGIGFCGNMLIRQQLDEFVKENFDLLYFGAVRRGESIPDDYYAPRRVQINNTRLNGGLKIAGGHHRKYEEEITDAQLREAIADIQTLIDAAAEEKPAAFTLTITAASCTHCFCYL